MWISRKKYNKMVLALNLAAKASKVQKDEIAMLKGQVALHKLRAMNSGCVEALVTDLNIKEMEDAIIVLKEKDRFAVNPIMDKDGEWVVR